MIIMDNNHVIKKVLRHRLAVYLEDKEAGACNIYNSPVFGLFNASIKFGMFKEVASMIEGDMG